MNIEEAESLYPSITQELPAYRRLQLLITSQLATGALKPGDSIPSENEFVNALGISRMTVNRAIRELSSAGYLTRVRGLGTFVSETGSNADFITVRNSADTLKRKEETHTQKVIVLQELHRATAPNFWKTSPLSEKMPDTVYHSVIVHYENDEPFQVEERFVAPQIAPNYLEQDFSKNTPAFYLGNIVPASYGVNRVDATHPDQNHRELLQLKESDPCLRIETLAYHHQELVLATCLIHPGSRIILEGEFGK